MRVLVANKFWYRRGGLERVMFDEIGWLEQAGHDVAHFSAAHPANDPSPWERYFAPYLELGADGPLSRGDKLRAAARMFSNREAAARFSALVSEFRPDVVHIHGIHRQLSPSILDVARHRGIPVVQTLHDYHHVCPADVLLKGGTSVCEPRACGTLWYGPAIASTCVRGSRAASALSALETAYQRSRRAYERSVVRFISPSRFLADVMRDGGWQTPCDVIPNAVPLPEQAEAGGGYALFAGRLATEKGVDVLLEAAAMAGVEVVVAGEGPLEDDLQKRFPDVDFRGRVDGGSVQGLITGALACVVPSTSYENAPMSVLEPMASGVPVVASAIGGIPELIEDGVSGLLVSPGDVAALAAALVRLRDTAGLADVLGGAARERVAARFSPAAHMEAVLETYAKAVSA